MVRPDLLWAVNDLARKVTKWIEERHPMRCGPSLKPRPDPNGVEDHEPSWVFDERTAWYKDIEEVITEVVEPEEDGDKPLAPDAPEEDETLDVEPDEDEEEEEEEEYISDGE